MPVHVRVSRRHVLQAQPDHILADVILSPPEPALAGKASKHHKSR